MLPAGFDVEGRREVVYRELERLEELEEARPLRAWSAAQARWMAPGALEAWLGEFVPAFLAGPGRRLQEVERGEAIDTALASEIAQDDGPPWRWSNTVSREIRRLAGARWEFQNGITPIVHVSQTGQCWESMDRSRVLHRYPDQTRGCP